VHSLREAGYEVRYVAEMWPGISDPEVLHRAQDVGSILLTGDKDFGELVFRRGGRTAGIVLFRLSGLPQHEKVLAAVEAFQRYSARFANAFTVVERGRVRIRR